MADVKTGQFVWHDLLTTDVEGAKKFYGELFGWKYQSWDGAGMPYTMFGASEIPAGGVSNLPQEARDMGAPPHWLMSVHVPNADEAATKTQAAGGMVLAGPMDIPTVGRMSILRDPQGGVISAFTFADPERYMGMPQGPGEFCWYEMMASDPATAYEFYRGIFDWGREEMDMGPMGTYHVLRVGETQTGGICRIPEGKEIPPHWLAYIDVEDIDATLAKAESLGATVYQPKLDIGFGEIAILADPQGAAFAVYHKKPQP